MQCDPHPLRPLYLLAEMSVKELFVAYLVISRMRGEIRICICPGITREMKRRLWRPEDRMQEVYARVGRISLDRANRYKGEPRVVAPRSGVESRLECSATSECGLGKVCE